MKYRRLGRTGLMVSEIGFGAEWMERHDARECKAVLDRAEELLVSSGTLEGVRGERETYGAGRVVVATGGGSCGPRPTGPEAR